MNVRRDDDHSGFGGRESRLRFTGLLKPLYAGRVTATAEMIRDQGHHVGSEVVITRIDGVLPEPPNGSISGVERITVDEVQEKVSFSLIDPTRANIVPMTQRVCTAFKLDLIRDDFVITDDPRYALLEHFDYKGGLRVHKAALMGPA
jgi:hypothetical protein